MKGTDRKRGVLHNRCGMPDMESEYKEHLSREDKNSLLCGGFLIGSVILSICLLVTGLSYIFIFHENGNDMKETYDMIFTYLATATDDEYEEISESVRRDLVYSEYRQDVRNYMQYIPNTSEGCPLHQNPDIDGLYFVMLNTGEIYGMDTSTADPQLENESAAIIWEFGYDEISGDFLTVEKDRKGKECMITLQRGEGIISLHKMKELFCDECILKILEASKEALVQEAVYYNVSENKIYPILQGDRKMGKYNTGTEYNDGAYRTKIVKNQ